MNWSRAAIVPILLAAVVFAFSISALWLGDDIFFTFSIADGSKITSLGQVIPSQIAHYRIMNGRIPAHFLCQLYLPFLGKEVFAISNALVYVALLLMMACLASVKYDDWRKMALLACLILLGFRTKFTPTCQIGFPWMFALVAAFLLVLKRFGKNDPHRMQAWNLVWAIPLAFIAGWSQEALVIGVGTALAIYTLSHIKQVSFPQWTLLAAFAVGAALLCLSPAAIKRAAESHSETDLLSPALFSLAKLGFYLRVSPVLLAWILYLLVIKKRPLKSICSSTGFYWIIWGTLLLFNLLIGVFGNRQLFGMEFAAILILTISLREHHASEENGSRLEERVLLAFLSLCVVGVSIDNVRFLTHHHAVLRQIDSAYKSSDDGTVYYDFSAAEVTSRDTYPSDAFTWHALEELRRSYGETSTLRVVPKLCEHLDDARPGNHWERIAHGAIAIVVDKDNPPSTITVQRSILNKRLSDSYIDPSQSIFEDERFRVLVLYEKLPFVRHDGVSFGD